MILGRLEGDVIVDANAITRKGIGSNKSIGAFSRIKGRDMEVFLPGSGEFVVGLVERVLEIDARSLFHEVHAPLIEGVVDFENHCLEQHVLGVNIPERDWIENISKESWSGHKVCIGVVMDRFSLTKWLGGRSS